MKHFFAILAIAVFLMIALATSPGTFPINVTNTISQQLIVSNNDDFNYSRARITIQTFDRAYVNRHREQLLAHQIKIDSTDTIYRYPRASFLLKKSIAQGETVRLDLNTFAQEMSKDKWTPNFEVIGAHFHVGERYKLMPRVAGQAFSFQEGKWSPTTH